MSEFPIVKGWKPFISVLSDIEKKERKEKEKKAQKDNTDDSEKVDVPKDWKTPPFKLEDNPHKRLFAVTEEKVLFQSRLNTYLTEVFPIVQKSLEAHFIKARLVINDGEMIVETTRKTFDPVMILRAKSVISLLARYVPVEEALRVLEDDVSEDIIPISHSNQDTFHRRRGRFLEPSIKELIKELLDCNIYVAGKAIAAVGSYSNLRKLRDIVHDCFHKNIHPIFSLKRLQVIKKLMANPEMKDKDWSEFIPKSTKKNVKTKKPFKVREKKEYNAFPPAIPVGKIDKELEDGVFHMKYEKAGKKYFKLIGKNKAKEDGKKEETDKKTIDGTNIENVNRKRKNADSTESSQRIVKKIKREKNDN